MCMRLFGEESSVSHLSIDKVDLITHILIEYRAVSRENSGDGSKSPIS